MSKKLYVQVDYAEDTEAPDQLEDRLQAAFQDLDLEPVLDIGSAPTALDQVIWSRSDLHDIMDEAIDETQKAQAEHEGNWYVHLLVARSFRDPMLGLMFDTDIDTDYREGCAVFWDDIKTVEPTESFSQILTRTMLHEIGHCLNLTHARDDSLMARTKDLQDDDDWIDNVRFSFNGRDQRWVRNNPHRAKPGSNVRFRGRTGEDRAKLTKDSDLQLEIQCPAADRGRVRGAPVPLVIRIKNKGDKPLTQTLPSSLADSRLSLKIQDTEDQQTRYYQDPLCACDMLGISVTLQPGEAVTLSRSLWFDRHGPLFSNHGRYRLTCCLTLPGEPQTRIMSNVLSLIVTYPSDEILARSLVHPRVGRFLSLEGGPQKDRLFLLQLAKNLEGTGHETSLLAFLANEALARLKTLKYRKSSKEKLSAFCEHLFDRVLSKEENPYLRGYHARGLSQCLHGRTGAHKKIEKEHQSVLDLIRHEPLDTMNDLLDQYHAKKESV